MLCSVRLDDEDVDVLEIDDAVYSFRKGCALTHRQQDLIDRILALFLSRVDRRIRHEEAA